MPNSRNGKDHMSKTEKDLVPLVDCDILQYACGFAADSQIKKEYKEIHPDASDDDIKKVLEDTEYTNIALQNVKTVMEGVTGRFNEGFLAYIQEGRHFRYDVATIKPYKGNRDVTHKPKYYKEIKDYLIDRWAAIPVTAIETDDAIGIEQWLRTDKYSVIVSIDKDMDMIPGWHYNWKRGELYYQPLEEANLFLFYQMLTGDTVDNIQGIYGLGPKKSGKILDDNGRDLDKVRTAVQKIYQDTYGEEWERYYQEIGRLLYILRRYEHKDTGAPFLYA